MSLLSSVFAHSQLLRSSLAGPVGHTDWCPSYCYCLYRCWLVQWPDHISISSTAPPAVTTQTNDCECHTHTHTLTLTTTTSLVLPQSALTVMYVCITHSNHICPWETQLSGPHPLWSSCDLTKHVQDKKCNYNLTSIHFLHCACVQVFKQLTKINSSLLFIVEKPQFIQKIAIYKLQSLHKVNSQN